MSLVEFNNVYKRYKTGEIVINAVDGISFKVEEGEFAIVVGAWCRQNNRSEYSRRNGQLFRGRNHCRRKGYKQI